MQNTSCVNQEISPQVVVNVVTMKKGELFDLIFGLERFFICELP